ncbi:MAG: hypothetical protein KJP02_08590 [Octadecabacter sp.]|nr:hypothetical protein [Octadecabacter sp.]
MSLTLGHVPSAIWAQTSDIRVLTPQDLRLTAFAALREGQPARALALSEALLVRDPQDLIALRVASQAALEIGQSDVALRHGRSLYRAAETDDIRFFAARIVSLAFAQKENFTRAQLWLRRARQAAPDEAAAQSVARDYAAVRGRNPLSINLDFGVRPSSNVNNGSSESTFELFGLTFLLSPSAQELSGNQISAGAKFGYTLQESPESRTVVTISGEVLRYSLSREAKLFAPSFDVSTLDYDRAVLGLRQDWRAGKASQPLTATVDYGLSRVGGELYARDLVVGLSTQWATGQRSAVQTGVRFGHVTYTANNDTSKSLALDLGWTRALNQGDTIFVRSTLEQTSSDDSAALNSNRTSVSIGYDFGRLANTFDLGVEVGAQWRNYDPDTISPDGRSDMRTDLTLTVGLPLVEFYGLSPVATLEAYQTDSNVSRYRSEGISLDLAVRSNF